MCNSNTETASFPAPIVVNTTRLPILLLLLTLVAFAQPAPVRAQYQAAVQLISTYDNNSFAFYDRRADVYHQLFVALSRDFETDYSFIQAYYYGAGVLFRTYAPRTYHQHALGALWAIQLSHREDGEEEDVSTIEADTSDEGGGTETLEGDDEAMDDEAVDDADTTSADEDTGPDANPEEGIERVDHARETATVTPPPASPPAAPEPPEAFSDSMVTYLHIAPSIAGRFDRDAYDMYDSRSATMSGTLRQHILGPLMARLHVRADYRQYPNMPQFTNLENLGMLTLNLRLHSTTELFTSVDFGYKSYTETVSDTIYNSGNSGKGKGSVKPKIKSIASFSTPSTDQFVIAAGIVETVAPEHRVSLSWLHRINPRNVARFLDKRTESDIQAYEADVFDDRYGYEADELSLRLDSRVLTLPLAIQIDHQAKRYPRVATGTNGIENSDGRRRSDRRLEVTAQLTLPLLHATDGSTRLSLGASWTFIRNQSNDAYHDYHIHQAALVIDWNL